MIDGGVAGDNYDAVDAADANALYRLLEEEVVPAFYDRDAAGVPHRWLATVKESIRTRRAALLARGGWSRNTSSGCTRPRWKARSGQADRDREWQAQ